MTEFGAFVLFSAAPDQSTAFYRALGVPLEDEVHDDGAVHQACELGPVHVAVYPAESGGRAPERRGAGSVFAGFFVPSLDETVAALEALPARIAEPHEQMPWGCRVVAEDPDGRSVEINQRGHCD